MKKLLILLLSFLLIISCVGCEKDSPKVEETDEPIKEVDVAITDELTLTLKGNTLEEYEDIDVSEINKFLGTAIVKLRPEEFQKNDIPIISTTEKNSDLIFALMHLSPEYVDTYAISVSESNTRAYTFAIVKPQYYCEELLMNAYTDRIDDLTKALKDYPDQLYLVENCVFESVGDYLVLIICDNAKDVYNQLVKVMAETDLTIIEPVPMMSDTERESIEKEYLNKTLNGLDSEVGDVVVTPIEDPEVESNKDVLNEDNTLITDNENND